MVQLTVRDERMLEWLSVVRIADVDGIRHALSAFGEGNSTIALRRAQRWVKRMVDVGIVGRVPATMKDGSLMWVTSKWSGRREPNAFAQTTRHEVAVALVSALYLERGYGWQRDEDAERHLTHQVDGIATRGDERVLIEVELTQKQRARYRAIFIDHVDRLEHEGFTKVAYFGTPEVIRAVDREANRHVLGALRSRITTHPAFDVRGWWRDEQTAGTMDRRHVAVGTRHLAAVVRADRLEVSRGKH